MPAIGNFKLLQILGEGYEGKVLQVQHTATEAVPITPRLHPLHTPFTPFALSFAPHFHPIHTPFHTRLWARKKTRAQAPGSDPIHTSLGTHSHAIHTPVTPHSHLIRTPLAPLPPPLLQARKKDCGVMYALKVLDKQVLASRSRRWQLHATRELECLRACDHPYIVSIAYAFQTPQYLYMVQEHVPNHTLARYLEAHDGKPMKEAEVSPAKRVR